MDDETVDHDARGVHAYPSPKVVEIDWNDSWSAHGWTDRKARLLDVGQDAGTYKSVGFVIEENDDRVTLAESISKNDNVGCTTSIPRFAIVRMVTLREAVE